MLINFSVTNYKVFKEKTTLSMVTNSDKRLPENTIELKQYSRSHILKMAAIYGANASGKTTMIRAIELFLNFIKISASHDDRLPLNHTPFLFDKTEKKPTSFSAEFISNEIRYEYGFSYDSRGITEEHLYKYPKGRKSTVFERNGMEYVFKSDIKFHTENSRRVRKNSLYVSVCSQFNDSDCLNVMRWATEDMLVIAGYDVTYSLDVLTRLMSEDMNFKRIAQRAFRIADMGITDVKDRMKSISETVPSNTVNVPLTDIWVKHEFNGMKKELPIGLESSGTIRFLSLIGPVIMALIRGNTIVVDELDMSFHTDLCEWICSLFSDPTENKKNAQLIFNTHDVILLDQSKVRRDQIYLVIKDWKTGFSEMRRLSEYRIRNDLDIRKAYLNGSFGGKPFIAPESLMEP